ncbi:MAG: zinc protease [Cognaticolwellia sp.]|jgi:zinc protease
MTGLGLLALMSAPTMAQDGGQMDVTAYPKLAKKPGMQINILPYELTTGVYTFPSGFRVMFQSDNTLPVVASTMIIDHGSSDDPQGMEGMAHLYEHLWFRTEQGDLPKTWDLLNHELGCSINAYTQYDHTGYMTVCPADHFDKLVALEGLRLTASMEGVPEDTIPTEIEVVRNEIRMRSENGNIPFFALLAYITKHAYPADHPYHRPIAGDHTSIRNITYPDVVEWVEGHYTADKATLMFVGDFEQDRAMDYMIRAGYLELMHADLTQDHIYRYPRPGLGREPVEDAAEDWWFVAMDPSNPDAVLMPDAEIPVRAAEFADAEVPDISNKAFGEYVGSVEDPKVVVAWTLPPSYQGNDTLMNITSSVLGNIIGNATAAGPGLADVDLNVESFDGCGALAYKRATVMVCTATLKDPCKDPQKTAERMLDRAYYLYDPTFGLALERELSQVRMDFLAGIFRNLDLFAVVGGGRATEIAVHAHYTGNPMYHSSQMNEVMSLTAANIADLGQTWITRDRATSLVVRPLDREGLLEVSMDGAEHYGDGTAKVVNSLVDPDDITPELILQAYRKPELEHMTETTLPNGLRVVAVSHSEAPIARASLIVKGGTATDPDRSIWMASQTDNLYMNPRGFNAGGALPDPLAIAGVWNTSMSAFYQSVDLTASAGNLDGMLWMMRDAMEELSFDTDNRADWVKGMREDHLSDIHTQDYWISNTIYGHINPGHPAVTPMTSAEINALKKIGGGDISAKLHGIWQPENATLLIVGNVDPEDTLALAAQYFGGWEPKTEMVDLPDYQKPNPAKKGRAIYLFDDPGKTQTTVALRCQIPDPQVKPDPRYSTLSAVLREQLFSRLRENSGVVYSPAAFVSASEEVPQAIMSASVQNPAVVYTLETYIKTLEEVEAGTYDPDHIKRSQYTQAWASVLSYQSITQLSGVYSGVIGQGFDWGVWDRNASALAGFDSEGLAEALGDCSANAVVTMIGPLDVIKPILDDAGLEYNELDWKELADNAHRAEDPKDFKKYTKKKARSKKKADKKKARVEKRGGTEECYDATVEG